MSLYCPTGSAAPSSVGVGYFSTPVDGDAARRTGREQCPPGHYCSGNGFTTSCPPGTYGSMPGLGSMACSGECAAGRYGGTGEMDEDCSGPCVAGSYCPSGSTSPDANPCPAGRYGGASADSASCDGPCAAGYFCSQGSVTPTPTSGECKSPSFFCPAGSSGPVPPLVGHYSVQGEPGCPPEHYCSQEACPLGHYCWGGLLSQCPAGRYGNTTGLATLECSGLCPPGRCVAVCGCVWLCVAVCGCVWLCVAAWLWQGRVGRLYQVLTSMSCTRYGATSALPTSSCSGVCDPGAWCAAGSTLSSQNRCAAGRWSGGGSGTADCDGLCQPGFVHGVHMSCGCAELCNTTTSLTLTLAKTGTTARLGQPHPLQRPASAICPHSFAHWAPARRLSCQPVTTPRATSPMVKRRRRWGCTRPTSRALQGRTALEVCVLAVHRDDMVPWARLPPRTAQGCVTLAGMLCGGAAGVAAPCVDATHRARVLVVATVAVGTCVGRGVVGNLETQVRLYPWTNNQHMRGRVHSRFLLLSWLVVADTVAVRTGQVG